jgi:hypothetical protein
MVRYAAVAAALVFLGACDLDILGPEVRFENRLPLEPLREYEAWYQAVESCRSSRGDYARIRWFVAEEIMYHGAPVAAYQSGDRITIRSDFVAYGQIIRHEADHHVTGRDNSLHLPDGTTACDGGPRAAVID